MPPKIRVLKADLTRAGFTWRQGKGSHQVWFHPHFPSVEVTVSGGDGEDARRYQLHEIRDVIDQVAKPRDQEDKS